MAPPSSVTGGHLTDTADDGTRTERAPAPSGAATGAGTTEGAAAGAGAGAPDQTPKGGAPDQTPKGGAPDQTPRGGAPEAAVATGNDWVACQDEPLPVAEAMAWAVAPECGAVTSFIGTVRDHAEGRTGVHTVTYEAYREQVVPRLAAVVTEARRRWPALGRVALVHRLGALPVGAASVLVVVAAPHRAEAFDAARFCIDTLKRTVPIWKHEAWSGGSDWGLGASDVLSAAEAAALHPAPATPTPVTSAGATPTPATPASATPTPATSALATSAGTTPAAPNPATQATAAPVPTTPPAVSVAHGRPARPGAGR